MPEGPELLHSRDMLQQFVGLHITASYVAGGRYTTAPPVGHAEWADDPATREAVLLAVEVKGKFMWWRLGPRDAEPAACWHMLCTYGMSGGWTTLEATHPAFVFMLGDAEKTVRVRLTFDDARHFGTLKFVRGTRELERKLASLGPDMLADPPDELGFTLRVLRRPRVTLAEALMDQHTVSGIGNYVKAESLWLARLSPHRIVSSLTVEEFVRLRAAIIDVLTQSYGLKGATIRSYADPDGNVGAATSRFACYGRRVDLDGLTIVPEETMDGRTTWWCPERQR